jgi:hypothetical protein
MIKEDFTEAKTCFQNFLSENNHSTDLVWLFSEDVIWRKNQFLINLKSILENEVFAEKIYKKGQERDFGVAIFAFCEFDEKIGCSIILPEDDLDAQYRLMSNESLKYSFRTEMAKAKLIENALIWKFHKKLASNNIPEIWKDSLPSKNLQFQVF